jgi:hypothetical protein
LVAKPHIFGKSTFAYLDAGESATRRYTAFLTKVPNDFVGVRSVLYRDGRIVIQERGGSGREVILMPGRLF